MYTNWATRIFWYLHWKINDFMYMCRRVLVYPIYSIQMWYKSGNSLNKYWIWWRKKSLDSWNKNDLRCMINGIKMYIIVYKPRRNLLSQLMIHLFSVFPFPFNSKLCNRTQPYVFVQLYQIELWEMNEENINKWLVSLCASIVILFVWIKCDTLSSQCTWATSIAWTVRSRPGH